MNIFHKSLYTLSYRVIIEVWKLLCEFIGVWPHCYDHQGRDPLFLIQYVHWINVWEWTGSTDVSSISKQNNLQNVEKLILNGLVCQRIMTSFIYILVYFLAHPNFDLVSYLLALFTARKLAQVTIEMIENYYLR